MPRALLLSLAAVPLTIYLICRRGVTLTPSAYNCSIRRFSFTVCCQLCAKGRLATDYEVSLLYHEL